MILLAIVGGWLVSGHFLKRLEEGNLAMKEEPAADGTNPAGKDTVELRRRLQGWSPEYSRMEGSVENANRESALRMETFMFLPVGIYPDGTAHFPRLFESNDSLAILSRQLDLKISEIELLEAFLKRAAASQIEREKGGMRAEETEANHYKLNWTAPDADLLLSLKLELVSFFTEDLAMSIWIRGDMDRFHEPVPSWDGAEITLHLKPGTYAKVESVVNNGEREWTGDVLNPQGKPHIQLRLDGLFEIPDDLNGLIEKAGKKDGKYPVAKGMNKPGFVISPYSEKLVDVRDLPPGTLVQDPTMPMESKSYFLVPAEE